MKQHARIIGISIIITGKTGEDLACVHSFY